MILPTTVRVPSEKQITAGDVSLWRVAPASRRLYGGHVARCFGAANMPARCRRYPITNSRVPHPNLAHFARLGWDSTTASIFGFCRPPTTVFPTTEDQRLVFPTTVFLTLPCFLLSLFPNKRIVQSRQRIELRRFLQILLRFRRISASPVSLAQPIEILRILQVCLLEFRKCLSVIFLRQRNSSGQLMRLFQLRIVLPGLGPFAEFLRMTLRRGQIFFPDRY